jgi:sugar O-acyltransferase (sialic acid O-acetyltransferase NeuD family)
MFDETTLLVFGAGGHAKVVIDAAEKQGYRHIIVADDAEELRGKSLMGYAILGGREVLRALDFRSYAIAAVGSNAARGHVADWLAAQGFVPVSIVHPSSQIARGARIGAGSLLVAGSIVNSDAVLGANVIVNTCATVDHDCLVGDNVHIAPGVHLCGEVAVGSGTLLGVGAVVVPGVRIGAGCLIGAGATVIRDVPDGARVAGTPAHVIGRGFD